MASEHTPVVPSDEQIERLKDAIEGECDGLSIDDAHARAILEYVLAPPPGVLVESASLLRGPFKPANEGRTIDDEDSEFDVFLHLDGNWDSDQQRKDYAQDICDRLNATPSAPLAEAAKALSFEVRSAAERMERAYHECYIPTGALWRGITDSKWQQARAAFHEAVKRLAALAEPAAPLNDERERATFYAALGAHTELTGHKPTMLDVWLMARGWMTPDGRATQPAEHQGERG